MHFRSLQKEQEMYIQLLIGASLIRNRVGVRRRRQQGRGEKERDLVDLAAAGPVWEYREYRGHTECGVWCGWRRVCVAMCEQTLAWLNLRMHPVAL